MLIFLFLIWFSTQNFDSIICESGEKTPKKQVFKKRKTLVSKKHSSTDTIFVDTPSDRSETEADAPKPKRQRIKKMANRMGYGTTKTPKKQQIEEAEASCLKKIQ